MSARTRKGTPTALKDVMPSVLSRAGVAARVQQAAVLVDWARLVGPQVARAASAEAVTADGTLFVRVRSAAWRQELSLMTHDIMARLNAGRRIGRIERIRWMVGGTDG